MISLQGIICKQLKNQGKLPEKYKDLAMQPKIDASIFNKLIALDQNNLVVEPSNWRSGTNNMEKFGTGRFFQLDDLNYSLDKTDLSIVWKGSHSIRNTNWLKLFCNENDLIYLRTTWLVSTGDLGYVFCGMCKDDEFVAKAGGSSSSDTRTLLSGSTSYNDLKIDWNSANKICTVSVCKFSTLTSYKFSNIELKNLRRIEIHSSERYAKAENNINLPKTYIKYGDQLMFDGSLFK